jgi:hypothetical protein
MGTIFGEDSSSREDQTHSISYKQHDISLLAPQLCGSYVKSSGSNSMGALDEGQICGQLDDRRVRKKSHLFTLYCIDYEKA